MRRTLLWIGLLCVTSSGLGCAMCCGPDDYNYAAYGGRWQRHDMAHGRVGSILSHAGSIPVEDEAYYERSDELPPPPVPAEGSEEELNEVSY